MLLPVEEVSTVHCVVWEEFCNVEIPYNGLQDNCQATAGCLPYFF